MPFAFTRIECKSRLDPRKHSGLLLRRTSGPPLPPRPAEYEDRTAEIFENIISNPKERLVQ